MKIPTFSPELTNKTAAMPYPNLQVFSIKDSLALTLRNLDDGDLPVIAEVSGDKRQIKKMRLSALDILKVLEVSPCTLHFNATESCELHDTMDIMEAILKIKGT